MFCIKRLQNKELWFCFHVSQPPQLISGFCFKGCFCGTLLRNLDGGSLTGRLCWIWDLPHLCFICCSVLACPLKKQHPGNNTALETILHQHTGSLDSSAYFEPSRLSPHHHHCSDSLQLPQSQESN